LVAALWLSFYLFISSFLPSLSARFCGEYQEINIKTGQARERYFFCFLTVSEEVKDTPISLALQGETVDVSAGGAWQLVDAFPLMPSLSTPHYLFHGALGQANAMASIALRFFPDDVERKRELARNILIAWQESGRGVTASEVMNKELLIEVSAKTTEETDGI